jgi:hypothetical protein
LASLGWPSTTRPTSADVAPMSSPMRFGTPIVVASSLVAPVPAHGPERASLARVSTRLPGRTRRHCPHDEESRTNRRSQSSSRRTPKSAATMDEDTPETARPATVGAPSTSRFHPPETTQRGSPQTQARRRRASCAPATRAPADRVERAGRDGPWKNTAPPQHPWKDVAGPNGRPQDVAP